MTNNDSALGVLGFILLILAWPLVGAVLAVGHESWVAALGLFGIR